MPKQFCLFVSAPELFLIKDGKILLARRFNTGYEDGNYGVPSGHIELHEKAVQTMIREAKEEIGIDLNEGDLKLVHVMHRISIGTHPSGCDQRIGFFFEATKWNGEPTIMEINKCDDLSWFPLNQLPNNIIPYVRTAIEHYQNSIPLSEFGWN